MIFIELVSVVSYFRLMLVIVDSIVNIVMKISSDIVVVVRNVWIGWYFCCLCR